MRPCPVHMQCKAGSSYQLEPSPSMDRYRAPKAKPDHAGDADDSDELAVFAAERYFYGDDDSALWPCGRSSSSLSSSAFRAGTHEHDRSAPTPTAVTSSSEASWNSRSALLPTGPTAEKSHAVAVAAAATPVIKASASGAEGQPAGRRPASSLSNLQRWLLGVAACACAGGASEESVSAADEMETSERFPGAETPAATAARSSAAPASGRWLLQGDTTTLAGTDGHRRATNKGELSTPILELEPRAQAAATSDSNERRRIKSLEMLRPVPVPVGDRGSAPGSATQSSAFTIVAGNTALGVDAPRAASAGGGGGSPGEDDDAAATPSELGCAYPPSEASVVWSVVTADGAASGNFSSAASGYYYHYCFNDVGEGAAMRRTAARNTHRRRSGIPGGSSLLMCMSDKAVDAVGPARSVHRQEIQPATLGASGGSRNGHGVYKPART